MKKFIEKLHFITHDNERYAHTQQAQLACEAGAKWVQYRCLSKPDEALLKDITTISEICDDWGATLIVTNHLHLHGKADIQGFHLEDIDTDFVAIRNLLGDNFTLGGSANTLAQLTNMAKAGADYAGFGPFNTTTTKPNDYPLISLASYKNAVEQLESEGLNLPILAVGGVNLADVADLQSTGIHGIAVSSAILQADDFVTAYEDFYRAMI
jgi:thiamine-phosphate pyrophosphorylase